VQPIVLTRIAHVLPFVEVLRSIGAPVERELRRARLPTLLEELPDAHIAVVPALQFIRQLEHHEAVDDLGYRAASRHNADQLAAVLVLALRGAPTLYARLVQFAGLVSIESSSCRVALKSEGDTSRICANLEGFPRIEGLRFAEWVQIMVVTRLVQDVAGRAWLPDEITFRAQFAPAPIVMEAFPNSRILTGHDDTSITIPSALLHKPLHACDPPRPDTRFAPMIAPDEPDPIRSLKLALRAYLPDGIPHSRIAAEIAGTSVRTLQRRLASAGLNYSTLVHQVQFETAADLLADPAVSCLDAAMAVGYEDPSHFARAFRRIAGVSPSEFRRNPVADGAGPVAAGH